MKTYLVTGGSSGIGLATIQRLLETGRVINLDIKQPEYQHPQLSTHVCDLSDHQATAQCVASLEHGFDGVFLNAGRHHSANIDNIVIDDLIAVLNLNVISYINIIHTLRQHNRIKKHGSIVLCGSDQCFIAKHNSLAYATSKGAIAQMTKSMALDLAKVPIRVNAICPGTIDTPLYQQAVSRYCQRSGADIATVHQAEAQAQPLGRIGQADEVAKLVTFLLDETQSGFMTGALVPIDGGYTAQ